MNLRSSAAQATRPCKWHRGEHHRYYRGLSHFGVGLMGTADLSAPTNSNRIYLRPDSSDPYWTQADPVIDATWYPDAQIYTSLPTITTIDGVNQWRDGILQQRECAPYHLDFRWYSQRYPALGLRGDVAASDQNITLVGPGAVAFRAGSIMRIGDELIGYHNAAGKTIEVNKLGKPWPFALEFNGTAKRRHRSRHLSLDHSQSA